jgi:hypothetical protein
MPFTTRMPLLFAFLLLNYNYHISLTTTATTALHKILAALPHFRSPFSVTILRLEMFCTDVAITQTDKGFLRQESRMPRYRFFPRKQHELRSWFWRGF